MSTSSFVSARRSIAVMVLLVCGILVLAGCGESSGTRSQAAPTETESSIDSTVGPVSLGETVTVGPYEIALTRGQLLSNPQAGPDRVAIPTIPPGHVLAEIWVTVANPSETDDPEGLPVPDLSGFRLVDSAGTSMTAGGVGFSRSESTGTGEIGGLGSTMSTPIGDGQYVVLMPDYVVPADSAPLTLYFTPLSDRPNLVVAFTLD